MYPQVYNPPLSAAMSVCGAGTYITKEVGNRESAGVSKRGAQGGKLRERSAGVRRGKGTI